MNITILGDGAWGTTLGILLSRKNIPVTMWSIFPDALTYLDKVRENKKYLPGVKIPQNILFQADLSKAIKSADIIIIAIPSQFFRSVVQKIAQTKVSIGKKIFVSVAKGIEEVSLKTMSTVIREELGNVSSGVVSGPNIASEIAREIPSLTVVAAKNPQTAKILQEILFFPYLRVYRSTDVLGLELCGSLKNIIAIVAGISDGLGFGTNTKAAIITRGIVEIQHLGVAMGAKSKTFTGLAGLGDLVTTCISKDSRNRTFGERIGRGEKREEILQDMLGDKIGGVKGVPEGVTTVKAALTLSEKYGVEMPLTKEAYSILYAQKSLEKAIESLMQREKKSE